MAEVEIHRKDSTKAIINPVERTHTMPPKAGSSSAKATPRTPKTAGKKAKEQEARKQRAAEREKAKEQATAQEGGRMGSAAKGKGKAKGTKRKITSREFVDSDEEGEREDGGSKEKDGPPAKKAKTTAGAGGSGSGERIDEQDGAGAGGSGSGDTIDEQGTAGAGGSGSGERIDEQDGAGAGGSGSGKEGDEQETAAAGGSGSGKEGDEQETAGAGGSGSGKEGDEQETAGAGGSGSGKDVDEQDGAGAGGSGSGNTGGEQDGRGKGKQKQSAPASPSKTKRARRVSGAGGKTVRVDKAIVESESAVQTLEDMLAARADAAGPAIKFQMIASEAHMGLAMLYVGAGPIMGKDAAKFDEVDSFAQSAIYQWVKTTMRDTSKSVFDDLYNKGKELLTQSPEHAIIIALPGRIVNKEKSFPSPLAPIPTRPRASWGKLLVTASNVKDSQEKKKTLDQIRSLTQLLEQAGSWCARVYDLDKINASGHGEEVLRTLASNPDFASSPDRPLDIVENIVSVLIPHGVNHALWGKQLPYLPDHRLVTQYAKDDKTLEVVVHLFASKAHTHIKDTKLTLGFMENVADLPGTIIIPTLHTMLRATSWLAAPLSVVPPNTEYDPAFAQLDFNIFGQPFWEVVKEKYEEFLGPHFISFATPPDRLPQNSALWNAALQSFYAAIIGYFEEEFSPTDLQDQASIANPEHGEWGLPIYVPQFAMRLVELLASRSEAIRMIVALIDPGFLMEVHGNSGCSIVSKMSRDGLRRIHPKAARALPTSSRTIVLTLFLKANEEHKHRRQYPEIDAALKIRNGTFYPVSAKSVQGIAQKTRDEHMDYPEAWSHYYRFVEVALTRSGRPWMSPGGHSNGAHYQRAASASGAVWKILVCLPKLVEMLKADAVTFNVYRELRTTIHAHRDKWIPWHGINDADHSPPANRSRSLRRTRSQTSSTRPISSRSSSTSAPR
ncbi:hypothetical protein CC2G_008255 [Coprinopsis cinerea AmutBmut pab1-1]|nr:hypothetical protein CC2G_008255 [Coprinopsis cinerea AmutBmut pab1-1]